MNRSSKRFKSLVFPAIGAGLVLVSAPALARNEAACGARISAVGVSSHVEGGRDFERYRGQVPPGLAKKRAIDNWQMRVNAQCPRYSNKWWRSRGQQIDCEGTAGHQYCTATSAPAKKFWSFLLSY